MTAKTFGIVLLVVLWLLLISNLHGQDHIEPARQAQIRAALKAHGYPGDMDTALRQVARDHNWQTKVAPDSRVLIFLGLGPKYSHLVNPETAWIATPTNVQEAKR